MSKIKIGIIFGGSSREREVSFAGGRTVYDNLDKSIFEPIPIFLDSHHQFILIEWQYIYKGTIRDFYPPVFALQNKSLEFQYYIENLGHINENEYDKIIHSVGKKIPIEHLSEIIDFAFLCLHGINGEDGRIQGLLEFYKIPYSGSGIFPSAFGINKSLQKKLMAQFGFNVPKYTQITIEEFESQNIQKIYDKAIVQVGFPMVIKPANQGSSIGVSILKNNDIQRFQQAIQKAFFRETIDAKTWNEKTIEQKIQWAKAFSDIRENIGLPAIIHNQIIYDPQQLINFLDTYLHNHHQAIIQALDSESEILIEEFIQGKEFSCIVIEDEHGRALALPPTEIIKKDALFDYKSKYLPGLSRKITPIDLPEKQIESIRQETQKMFQSFCFDVYARIDGFITNEEKIFLNDPNTTSGMMPSSFFFHQAAEIGLNPSQFLTYIIYLSLKKRKKQSTEYLAFDKTIQKIQHHLDKKNSTSNHDKIRIAVIMGGYSTERHISVESGRNVYEKLSSSEKYEPFPVFLIKSNNNEGFDLYTIPIRLMLKDNADDIKDKILNYNAHPLIQKIIKEASDITQKFGQTKNLDAPKKISLSDLKSMSDEVFIALHGRPGEDGTLQKYLDQYNIPYNGSGSKSSSITINKYLTNEILMQKGIMVAKHMLIKKDEWLNHFDTLEKTIRNEIKYPLIAKPHDDGCSSAVKKIKNIEELKAYARLIFRNDEELYPTEAKMLSIKSNEEFPIKEEFLVEELIQSNGAHRFLEITGGMLIKKTTSGQKTFEVFEPSETLVEGDVLSLEEKFLAGEGQNITPARFSKDPQEQKIISDYVKKQLQKTAEILDIEGYCRIDAFVRIYNLHHIEVIIIEVNSLPGMTPATCIYHQAAIHQYKPYEFIDAILTEAMNKKKVDTNIY